MSRLLDSSYWTDEDNLSFRVTSYQTDKSRQINSLYQTNEDKFPFRASSYRMDKVPPT